MLNFINNILKNINFTIRHFDYYIIAMFGALSFIGLLMLFDITTSSSSMVFVQKQLFWLIFSIIAIILGISIDLKKIKPYIPIIVLGVIVLLLLVLFFGNFVNGARRSLSLGPINIQPSLLARIALIFYFARFLDKNRNYIYKSKPRVFFTKFSPLILLTVITYILILMEKHLSTLIISSITLLTLLWVANIKKRTIFLIVLVGFVGVFSILAFGPDYRNKRMEIYQKYSLFHRLLGMADYQIETDELQVRESLSALSSGGFTGKGSMGGMAKYNFLPEAKTDYIFSIIGEQYGFLGSLIIFSLYIFLFYRTIFISEKNRNFYLQLAGIGLSLNIFVNVLVNIGVAMSALPSTGVTLPFISYGGTSFVINSFSIGLLMNISARSRYYE